MEREAFAAIGALGERELTAVSNGLPAVARGRSRDRMARRGVFANRKADGGSRGFAGRAIGISQHGLAPDFVPGHAKITSRCAFSTFRPPPWGFGPTWAKTSSPLFFAKSAYSAICSACSPPSGRPPTRFCATCPETSFRRLDASLRSGQNVHSYGELSVVAATILFEKTNLLTPPTLGSGLPSDVALRELRRGAPTILPLRQPFVGCGVRLFGSVRHDPITSLPWRLAAMP